MEDDDNIIIASADGRLDDVLRFLDAGVSVNFQDEAGFSPLHAAASYCHVEVVAKLLERGATVDLRDEDGDTPLHQCESAAVAELLLSAGADLLAVNSEGATPYYVAAEEGREEMFHFLAGEYVKRGVELPADVFLVTEGVAEDEDDDEEEA